MTEAELKLEIVTNLLNKEAESSSRRQMSSAVDRELILSS